MTKTSQEFVNIPVKPETKEKVQEKSEELGVSQAGLARMALKEKLETYECPYCGKQQNSKETHKQHVKRCFE